MARRVSLATLAAVALVSMTDPAVSQSRITSWSTTLSPPTFGGLGAGAVGYGNHLVLIENQLPQRAYVAEIGAGGAITAWTPALPPPAYVDPHRPVLIEDRLILAGPGGSWIARLATDGTITEWTAGPALPYGAVHPAAAQHDGRTVYVLAGGDASGQLYSDVVTATLQPDGSLSEWQSVTPLPYVLLDGMAEVVGAFLYVFGGEGPGGSLGPSSNVLRAPIRPDHTLGAWQSVGALVTPRPHSNVLRLGGTAHLVAGGVHAFMTSSVESALVGRLGVPGAAVASAPLPTLSNEHAAAVAGRFGYILDGNACPYGGAGCEVLSVYVAELAPSPRCATLTLDPASSLPVGANPQAVVTGDFNEDSLPDAVVTGDVTGGSTSLLLGAGGGRFQVPRGLGAGSGAISVAAADLDRDGHLDLVIANTSSDTVSVLLGNGDGTFPRRTESPVGRYPRHVVVADLDGDGILDVATANAYTSEVSVLRGLGGGAFAPHVEYPAGLHPHGIAVADLDRDGRADLVVACYGGSSVSVLRGREGGGFEPAVSYPLGTRPVWIGAADLDGDGIVDVVTANPDDGSVSVLLGTGSGTLQAPTRTSTGGAYPASFVVKDIDLDGFLDLIVANTSSSTVTVLAGRGDGSFAAPLSFVAGAGPTGVAVADFDGSGSPDVLTCDRDAAGVSLLLNACRPGDSAPTLTVPADIVSEATSARGALVEFVASAVDPEDGPLPATCMPASGSTFAIGATLVNCTAIDRTGHTAANSFTVVARDATPPTLNLPAPITVEATRSTGAGVTFSVSATDAVDGTVPVACTPASGSLFALGTSVVRCSAADSRGNLASGTFPVTVRNTVPPMVTVVLTDSRGAGLPGAVVTFYRNGWQPFGTTSGDGSVSRPLTTGSYPIRVELGGAGIQKTQDVGANPTVAFGTVDVAVRLVSSSGAPLDLGEVEYYANGWRSVGTTSGGEVHRELLPTVYPFAMTYGGGRIQKSQDVGANPGVLFETRSFVVRLKNAAGAPLDTGSVEYYANGWKPIGTTAGGEVRKELLPTVYPIALAYAGGRVQVSADTAAAPSVEFRTGSVVSASATCTSYYGQGWRSFTQGIELLPGTYPFRFSSGSPSQESLPIAAGTTNHIR